MTMLGCDVQGCAEIVILHGGDVFTRASQERVSKSVRVAFSHDATNDHTNEKLACLSGAVRLKL